MLLPYCSPARMRFLQRLENRWLAGEPAAGPEPIYLRVRARVPRVLYLNFLARRAFASLLAPDFFQPMALEHHPSMTLFTILLFELEASRLPWAPAWLGRLAPRWVQSKWRFYGRLTCLPEGQQSGVLFWCTVTDSLLLAAFGRRLARCFPLHRARRIELMRRGEEVQARAEPGHGSAPGLEFRGCLSRGGDVPPPFRGWFASFADYTRWIMNQHRSMTVWQGEAIIQDMHLTLEKARVTAVEPAAVAIPALQDFVETPRRPLSCFLAENLEVWLDSIRALPRRGGETRGRPEA